MQKGCIKIIKSDSKGIDSVTKDFYFQPKKIDVFSFNMFKYIAQLCLNMIVLCVVITCRHDFVQIVTERNYERMQKQEIIYEILIDCQCMLFPIIFLFFYAHFLFCLVE